MDGFCWAPDRCSIQLNLVVGAMRAPHTPRAAGTIKKNERNDSKLERHGRFLGIKTPLSANGVAIKRRTPLCRPWRVVNDGTGVGMDGREVIAAARRLFPCSLHLVSSILQIKIWTHILDSSIQEFFICFMTIECTVPCYQSNNNFTNNWKWKFLRSTISPLKNECAPFLLPFKLCFKKLKQIVNRLIAYHVLDAE